MRVREGRGVEAGEEIGAGAEVEVEVREVHQVGPHPPPPPWSLLQVQIYDCDKYPQFIDRDIQR